MLHVTQKNVTQKKIALSALSIAFTLVLPLSLLATGCSDTAGVDCATGSTDPACAPPTNTCSTTSQARFVVHQVTMPGSANHYSYDVDGNGSAENKTEDVVSGLEGAGLNIQQAFDAHLADGKLLMLIDIQGGSLMNGCSNVQVRSASDTAMPPKFDGTDSFVPSPDYATVKLVGNISNGLLTTTAPKNQPPAALGVLKISVPITLDYKLPLIVYGARVEGQLSATGITNGKLHGALRKTDLETYSFPVVAQALTQRINEPPNGSEEALMISLFEDQSSAISKAKCTNTPAKCCATNPTTCVITPEEVGACPLIQQLIAPDIEMFPGDSWSPTPGGAAKDSLSFGIGFAGVNATF